MCSSVSSRLIRIPEHPFEASRDLPNLPFRLVLDVRQIHGTVDMVCPGHHPFPGIQKPSDVHSPSPNHGNRAIHLLDNERVPGNKRMKYEL